VTRIRLPCRFTPDKTSSVVEVAPNASTIVFLLVLARFEFRAYALGIDGPPRFR
jgi:hypothetical protein